MKSLIKSFTVVFAMVMLTLDVSAQIQNFRDPGKAGLNVFEAPKTQDIPFNGTEIRVGGDFALQFQGLSQSNSGDSLAELANNFNLPTANLNLDVQLADGVRMHLRTYLSSRHHTEAYVKGGYMQIDKLDFIQEGFLEDFMETFRIRVGMDDINYGDAHFRRSDNASAIYNPFVGNYIMDSFTTEPFMELTYMDNGIIGVVGATNGRLNQSPTPGDDGIVLYGKVGYDKQINDDLRFRLTGSIYTSTDESTRDYLYHGDRAGGRYYAVLAGTDFDPRFDPGYASQTAFMINPFVKFQGLEFFGLFEMTNNGADAGGGYTQLGAEALYRFGSEENLYVGGRFNAVSGEQVDGAETSKINRINVGGGWFLTENILTKLEYVNESFDGDGWNGSLFEGAEFSGVMLEAVIAF